MNVKSLSKAKISPSILNIINNILRNGYLESPEYLKKYYLSILNENFTHYDFTNMTFLDHYNLTKKFLIMKTVDLETKKTVQLDPFITPDFKIIDALVATSCYWSYIGPYNINNTKYVDGRFTGQIFLEALKSPSIKKLKVSNKPDNVIGLYLVSNTEASKIKTNNIGYYNFFLYAEQINSISYITEQNLLTKTEYKKYFAYLVQFQALHLSSIEALLLTPNAYKQISELGIQVGNEAVNTYNKTKGKKLNPYQSN